MNRDVIASRKIRDEKQSRLPVDTLLEAGSKRATEFSISTFRGCS